MRTYAPREGHRARGHLMPRLLNPRFIGSLRSFHFPCTNSPVLTARVGLPHAFCGTQAGVGLRNKAADTGAGQITRGTAVHDKVLGSSLPYASADGDEAAAPAADLSSSPKVADEAAQAATGTDAGTAER
eukprot:gene14135-14267_t